MAISNVHNKDILVNALLHSGAQYGVQVIDYTYVNVDGVETKLFIVQTGRVSNDEWVPAKGTDNVFIYSEQVLKENYTQKWVKSRFKEGDFLISDGADRKVFYFESSDKVWRVDGGWGTGSTHATLASREISYGPLKLFTTANGSPFSNVIKGVHES